MAVHKAHLTYDDVVATLPHLDQEELLNLLEVLSSVLKNESLPGRPENTACLSLKGSVRVYGRRWTWMRYVRQERDSWL